MANTYRCSLEARHHLHIVAYLVLIITLWGKYCYHLHLIAKETEAQEVQELTQDHKSSMWQHQDSNLGDLVSDPNFVILRLNYLSLGWFCYSLPDSWLQESRRARSTMFSTCNPQALISASFYKRICSPWIPTAQSHCQWRKDGVA